MCAAAVEALGADGAAATLIAAAGSTLAHATDSTAELLDREQLTSGEGPSLYAFATQQPVIVDDLRGHEASQSWPLLAHAIDGFEVGRLIAMPVGVGAIRLGVLSIYSRLPGPALPGQLPAALLAADTAALALLDSDVDTPDALSLSELGPVLDYRIHQATGMVMGQTGLGARDALARLRAKAFTEDVPLQWLATDVIAWRVTFDPERA